MERKKAIQDFLSRYTLSDTEESILLNEKNLDENNYDYFTIHEKAISIRKSCDALLQDPYCILSCTVQLLERVSRQQEESYKLLFQWTQKQLEQCNTNSYIFDINDNRFHFFRRAFVTLKQRRSYFDHCLEILNSVRKEMMTKKFNEHQRSWDQRKKVGMYIPLLSDILASVHQTMGSEEELYQFIFNEDELNTSSEGEEKTSNSLDTIVPRSPLEAESTNQKKEEQNSVLKNEFDMMIHTSLDIIFSGIITPLTVRFPFFFLSNRI